jgi:uncharacterized protein YcfL
LEETSLAVQVLEATMGSTLNTVDLTIDNPTTAFSKEEEVHILFLTNIEGNQDVYYRVEWFDPRGMNVQTEENIIHSGQSKWYVSARPGPGGWSPGIHTVRLYFNGALSSTLNFTVSEP